MIAISIKHKRKFSIMRAGEVRAQIAILMLPTYIFLQNILKRDKSSKNRTPFFGLNEFLTFQVSIFMFDEYFFWRLKINVQFAKCTLDECCCDKENAKGKKIYMNTMHNNKFNASKANRSSFIMCGDNANIFIWLS